MQVFPRKHEYWQEDECQKLIVLGFNVHFFNIMHMYIKSYVS